LDRLLFAGFALLRIDAFVIMINFVSAVPLSPQRIGTTITAEQLSGKQIIVLALCRRGLFYFFAIFSCTRSNKSFGTITGIPSG
jgi:hypothetical protein